MSLLKKQSGVASVGAGDVSTYLQPLFDEMDIRVGVADATIAVGDCLSLDLAELSSAIGSSAGINTAAIVSALPEVLQKVIPTGTTAAGVSCVGVALSAASAGQKVYYVSGGLVPAVRVAAAGGVSYGSHIVPAGTAGAVQEYASGTHTAAPPIGFVLNIEDAGGLVAAVLYPRLP